MTLTTPYSATFIVGDGETKTFSYLFEEVSPNFISVMVYNSVTGLISTPTYVIDTDQKQVIFGEDTPAPTADETVCIYRNTPNVQDVAFRTLHGYDAQTLENILSKIVAMIQEIKSNYFSTQVLQGDPWQLDLLSSADDGATVNIDYTAKKLVKGLYFRITSGNLQVSADGVTYITLPKSDDVAEFRQYEQTLPDLTVIRKLQYRVGNQWFDAEANAQCTADEAYALAESVQTTMSAHINNTQNPHQTSMNNLIDTDFNNLVSGQFLQFNGINWVNVDYNATAAWGGIGGSLENQADLKARLDGKLSLDGSSTMTGVLKMRATSSFQCAIAPFWDGVGFYKLNNDDSVTLIASIETPDGFVPWVTNTYNIGSSLKKWKNLYLGGKLFVSKINNGGDLVVPNKAGTLATMGDVELAARSGTQLTDQGVWYAKMYAATVAPAAENGTNYADFSQVDGQGNPIIVTYNRVNGAWVQDQTITPPAEYDGYVIVTSKIWDIAEQTGQQGGRVLWNHTSKEFTPYPQIISFEDINVTGDSTVIMPQNPGANQIVNKDYVDEAIAAIPTPTVDVTQSIDAEIVGSPTISDGDVSNLSNQNYLVLPGNFDVMTGVSSFEIVVAFTTYASAISNQNILGRQGSGGIAIKVNNMNISFRATQSVSETQNLTGTTTLSPNTKYYAKVVYDGTNYTLSISTDGVTYTQEATAVATYLPGEVGLAFPLTAGWQENSSSWALGAIHMDAWYVKRNGVLVWQGMDAPGLHQKANIDLSNIPTNIDYVVESQLPTAQNNYTWYRKYKSGWIEQGGYATTSGNTGAQITLPVTMSDAHYLINGTCDNNTTGGVFHFMIYENQTTTGFTATPAHDGEWRTGAFYWEVRGMAA